MHLGVTTHTTLILYITIQEYHPPSAPPPPPDDRLGQDDRGGGANIFWSDRFCSAKLDSFREKNGKPKRDVHELV